MCIRVVLSVGGGVKGTFKLRLSLEGPSPIPNVYQRRRSFFFFWGGGGKIILNCCVCRKRDLLRFVTCINVVVLLGWGKKNLKQLRLSLEVPPLIH